MKNEALLFSCIYFIHIFILKSFLMPLCTMSLCIIMHGPKSVVLNWVELPLKTTGSHFIKDCKICPPVCTSLFMVSHTLSHAKALFNYIFRQWRNWLEQSIPCLIPEGETSQMRPLSCLFWNIKPLEYFPIDN